MSEGSSSPVSASEVNTYLNELLAEREKPTCTAHAGRLLDQEIVRLQNGGTKSSFIDIHKGRPIRLQIRVVVPVKDHPNFNFVGKLLGPKGNSLKRLQEETQTKMAILGRGSFRDKAKEEELRQLSDPKYSHLHEDLHVEVTTFAPPAEAYSRMAHAIAELKPFLVPDYYDDIRQNQLRELALLNRDNRKAGELLAGGSQSPTLAVSSTSPSLQAAAATSPVLAGAPAPGTAFPSVTAFPMALATAPRTLVPMRPGLVPVSLIPRLPVLQPNTAAAAAVAVAQHHQLHRLAAAAANASRLSGYSSAALQRQITEVTASQEAAAADQFLYGDEYPDSSGGGLVSNAVCNPDNQPQQKSDEPSSQQHAGTFTEEFVEWAQSPMNQCKIKARTRTIFTPYLVPRFGV